MNEEIQWAVNELEAQFPALVIEQAGGMCPFQASGTLHGMPLYFRFRHNMAALRIGGDLHFKALYDAYAEHGEQEDQGWLTYEDFRSLMRRLIGGLEHATIYWEFPGVQTSDMGVIKAGDPTTYGHWGNTAEEAWERLHEPSEYLLSVGIDAAAQAREVAARQMSPQTVTVDDRVFPDPDPFGDPR